MIKRESSALLFTDKIFFTVKKGTESVAAPTEQIFELDINEDPCKIGNTARQVLLSFIFDNARYSREDWKNVYEPLINRTKSKSIKKMFDNCKCVNIYSVDSKLMIVPSINKGYNKTGTKSLYEQMFEDNLDTITDCDFGKMILKAFEISTLEV